jgi:hypothetical protein
VLEKKGINERSKEDSEETTNNGIKKDEVDINKL